MPNETIDLLLSLKPAWAIEVARGDEDARVTADPPPENGLAFGLVRLRLVVTLRGEVKAFEEDGDRRLPASCPERHINADQSFCLGYPPRIVDDAYSASRWWNDLQRFMFLQAVAVETGVWPSAFALSHGSAADFEIMARAAARTLDAERDYEAALDGERNWLAHAFVNGGKDASDITADWRAQNAPPSDLEDAAWLEAMRALVVAEEHRTAALEEYWTWTRLSGRVCCGTMPGCALAAPSVASSGGATHD